MSPLYPPANKSDAEQWALFARYRFIRDEIVHEDGLIAWWLGWFLALQAFLLAALATANGSERRMPVWGTNYFFPLVPTVATAREWVRALRRFAPPCTVYVMNAKGRHVIKQGDRGSCRIRGILPET